MNRYAYIIAGTKLDEIAGRARRPIMDGIVRMGNRVGQSSQKGSALILALLILVVLTVIGITGANQALLQERMAGNTKQQTDALFAAESGLSRAENELLDADEADDSWDSIGCDNGILSIDGSESFEDALVAGEDRPYVYTVRCSDLDSSEKTVTLSSEGSLRGVEVERRVQGYFQIRGEDDPQGLPSDAPAAIGCLGGECSIDAGNNSHFTVSGKDHLLPEPDCSGNSCWLDPWEGEHPDAPDRAPSLVPSVYLEDRLESEVLGGNPANDPFCGAVDPDSDASGCFSPSSGGGGGKGKGTDDGSGGHSADGMDSVWDPSLYDDGQAPSTDEFFGEDSALYPWVGEDAEPGMEWGTREEPEVTLFDSESQSQISDGGIEGATGVLIIDGDDVELSNSGTGAFTGLIVVRNCGKLNVGGNFNIYGSVMVDSSDCEEDYDPYSGNGTPSIRYSSDALGLADQAVGDRGAGEGSGLQDWTQL